MKKIILFDVGGVIVNRTELKIYDEMAKEYGIKFHKVVEYVHKSLGDYEKDKISGEEHSRRFNLHVKTKNKKVHKIWGEVYQKTRKLNKGMMKLVESLKKNHTVGLLTNTIKPHYEFNKKNGLFDKFEIVFASNKIGLKKPSKNCYKYVIKKLKVKPEEIIFIDDKLRNIKGAKSCGIDGILFKNQKQLEKELKNRKIRW